jgi:hypothetical protein
METRGRRSGSRSRTTHYKKTEGRSTTTAAPSSISKRGRKTTRDGIPAAAAATKARKDPPRVSAFAHNNDDDKKEQEIGSLDIGACSLCHCSLDYSDLAAFCKEARHEDYQNNDTGSTDSYYYRKQDPYLPMELHDADNALLYCDTCPRLYHQQCHFVPVVVLSNNNKMWECLVCLVQKQQHESWLWKKSPNKKTTKRGHTVVPNHQQNHSYPYDTMFRSPPVASARPHELRWERDPVVIAMKSVLLYRELVTKFPKSFQTSISPYQHARTALQAMVSSRRNRDYFLTHKTTSQLVQSVVTIAKCKKRLRTIVQSLERVRNARYSRTQWDMLQMWLQQHGATAGDFVERTLFPFGMSYPRRWPPVTPEYRPLAMPPTQQLLLLQSEDRPHHHHHHHQDTTPPSSMATAAVTSAAIPSHITIHNTAPPPTATTTMITQNGIGTTTSFFSPAETTTTTTTTTFVDEAETAIAAAALPPSPARSIISGDDQKKKNNGANTENPLRSSTSPANGLSETKVPLPPENCPVNGGLTTDDNEREEVAAPPTATTTDVVDAVTTALAPPPPSPQRLSSSSRSNNENMSAKEEDPDHHDAAPAPPPSPPTHRYSTRSSPANGVVVVASAVPPPPPLSPIPKHVGGSKSRHHRRNSNEGNTEHHDDKNAASPPTTRHRYSTRSSPGNTSKGVVVIAATTLSPVSSSKRSISSRNNICNKVNNDDDKCPVTTGTRSFPPNGVTNLAKAAVPPEHPKSNGDNGHDDGSFSLDNLHCCVCLNGDSSDDNDMIMCDGGQCFRAYHANCLHPQVPPEILQDETANWFCPYCQALGDALHTIQRLSMNADEWEERMERKAKAKAAHCQYQRNNHDNASVAASWEEAEDVFPEADWELKTAVRLKAGEHDKETQRLLMRMLGMEEHEEDEALAMDGDDDDDDDVEEDGNFDVDSYHEEQRRKKVEKDGDQSSVHSSQASLHELSSVEMAIDKDELAALKEDGDGNNGDDNDSVSTNNYVRRRRLRTRNIPNDSDDTSDSDPGKMNPKNILPGKRRRRNVDYRKLNDVIFGDVDEAELLKLDDAEDFVSPSRAKVSNKRRKSSNNNEHASSDDEGNSCSDDGDDSQ